MRTLRKSQQNKSALLTSCWVASLVQTYPQQVNEQALRVHEAVCTGSYTGSFDKLDRELSCWKTSGPSLPLPGMTIVPEVSSPHRLPRWGITLNGCLYELPPLVRPTSANGGSAWPTPTATDYKGGACSASAMAKRVDRGVLRDIIKTNPDAPHTIAQGELNPDWEELLMGLPIGWTRPAQGTPTRNNGPRRRGTISTPTNHLARRRTRRIAGRG